MYSRVLWVFGLVLLALGADLAVAQQQYTLTPSLSVGETYDDNLFLRSKDLGRKSDYITTVSPGILFDMQSLHRDLQLNYVPTIVRYARSNENDTVRQLARVAYREDLAEHIRFDFTDDYIKSEDPIEISPDITGIRRNRNPYQRNMALASGTYKFGPENTLTAGYRNYLLVNDDPTIDDGTTHEPFVDLAYWFDKTHGVGLTYRYTVGIFSNDTRSAQPDYTGHAPGVRYLHRFSPQTKGYVSYSYAQRDFDQPNVSAAFSRDYTVHTWTVGLDKQLDANTDVSVSAGYFIRNTDAINQSAGSGPTYNAYLTRRFKRGSLKFGGAGGWDEQFLQAQNSGFVKYYRADANGEYFFLEKLSGYVGIFYRHNEYQDGIKDQTWRGNGGIRWAFHRYVSLKLDYTYLTRSSDNPLSEYDDNRLMLVLTATKPYKL